MLMTKEQPGLYPHLVQFVRTLPDRVPRRRRVWESFLGISGLTEAEGKKALKWSSRPLLRVVELHTNKEGKIAAGRFKPATPNVIYLNKVVADKFETDWQNSDARVVVEAIILHETVHWANYRAGEKHWHGRYGTIQIEHGDWFEVLAYGVDLRQMW